MMHPRAPITGLTRLYAVVGDPVAQVRAPQLLNEIFASSRRNAVAIPLQVAAEELDCFGASLLGWKNLDGLLITIPHKSAISKYASKSSAVVQRTGCANILRRTAEGWEADNFDGSGFVEGLSYQGYAVADQRVLLVGTGGAGAAIAAALAEQCPKALHVFDKNESRACDLLDRLGPFVFDTKALPTLPDKLDYDLAINATPLGLHVDDLLPFDPAKLPTNAVVADVIMEPHETALLRRAQQLGLTIHHGTNMLDAQIPFYRRYFGI